MPITTKQIDALFLGNFATGGIPTAASGSYVAPGGTGREATKLDLNVTANELQGVNSPSQIDFSLSNNNGSQGIDSGDGLGRQEVIYSQYIQVTFFATNGTSFVARMAVVQVENGDVFMFRDPTIVPQQNYNNLVGNREIESFSIAPLGTSRNGLTVAETDTFGNTFPDPPPCFTVGTMILTDKGAVAVETLRQGDLVQTMDHGLQPVLWIGVKTYSARQLAAHDNLRPIRITAGALGEGLPQSDLTVSPQHRMLVRSTIAQRMFGQDEVLVAAKHLVLLDGIDVAPEHEDVTYIHFLCSQHEVVFANGAPSETLYTGPQALKSIPPASRAEILAIFPELSDIDHTTLAARPLVKGRQGRQLAVRHKNNDKPLIELH